MRAGFLGSAGFYVPATPRPRSAAEAVRAAFRAPRDGREADLDQGMRAMRLLQVRPARGCRRAPEPSAPRRDA